VNYRAVEDTVWLNVGLVAFFILLGGLFAAAELALVSLRESQLDALEKRSRRGAAVSKLARDPNTFLAAVQIGVTVSGFFSAAFGATALAPVLEGPLRSVGINPVAAGVVAVIAMTLLVAYASLVFGELAPKRLALQKAEGFALAIAPLIGWIAVAFTPLIWLVGKSSDAVVKLLGGDPTKRGEVLSGEELKSIVESHESLGEEQREILSDVMEAAEQALISVMQPRGDVHCLLSSMAISDARALLQGLPYSRYPVITKSLDDCESFVHVRDVMWASKSHQTIADVARSIPILPSSMRVFPAMSELRREGKHIALVVDEYGGADGLVTLEDLVEELIGEVYDEHDPADRPGREDTLTRRGHFRGETSIRRFAELTGLDIPPGPYTTIAGFMLSELGHIPDPGASVDTDGATLIVHTMDSRRIALVSVHAKKPIESEPAAEK
jgi:putative hemolysin